MFEMTLPLHSILQRQYLLTKKSYQNEGSTILRLLVLKPLYMYLEDNALNLTAFGWIMLNTKKSWNSIKNIEQFTT